MIHCCNIWDNRDKHYMVDNVSWEIDTTPSLNCLSSAAEADKRCKLKEVRIDWCDDRLWLIRKNTPVLNHSIPQVGKRPHNNLSISFFGIYHRRMRSLTSSKGSRPWSQLKNMSSYKSVTCAKHVNLVFQHIARQEAITNKLPGD